MWWQRSERQSLENASLLVLNMKYGKPAKESKWSLEAEQARKQMSPQILKKESALSPPWLELQGTEFELLTCKTIRQ